ncbi:DUF6994 family protein [Membranihabitans marinus]|uniref:DUF6994 family protein n=1 Tax=Membranihabitans marinus TaxID=1227546 RepID=UPI001F2CAE80|nr:hypothetical protein [Membranihabitans marinus]
MNYPDSILNRYADFFKIFYDFKGYINFFMLQDFIDSNENIKFSLPFDGFNRSALPENKDEYEIYMRNTINLIDKRNKRILNRLNITSLPPVY